MTKQIHPLIKLLLVVCLLAAMTAPVHPRHADALSFGGTEQVCGDGYEATMSLPAGLYEVYASSGPLATSGISAVYSDFFGQECQELPGAEVKQDGVQLLGIFKTDALAGKLILLDSQASGAGNTNSPAVLFKDSRLACDVLRNCEVEYGGETFQLRPKKINMNVDSLRVAVYQPVEGIAVKKVLYSINGRQVYQTKTIEPFNLGYVPPGAHFLQRTVVLDDGQSLVDTERIEQTYAPSVLVRSGFYRYRNIILYSATAVIAFVCAMLAIIGLKRLSRWLRWKKQHSAGVGEAVNAAEALKRDSRDQLIRSIMRGVAISAIIVLLLVITSRFAVTAFRVDGLSMFTTFNNGETRLLNKLPVSFARLNNQTYIPNRGEIIVFNHAEENLFDPEGTTELNYVVKRVIALPGERVVLRNGTITVYSPDNPDGFNPDADVPWSDIIEPTQHLSFDIVVGTNQLFVAGDNRGGSVDSREYGPIEAGSIVGVVL